MPQVIMKCQPAGKRNSGRPVTSLLHCNIETGDGHAARIWKHDDDDNDDNDNDDDIRQSTLRINDIVYILVDLMKRPRDPLGTFMLLC